ncbi:major intrinsic protein superfamily membrane channel protein [Lactarius sanguifluus]|nr:major intrinsic protein superfamily membrane channel protein [Lactarius sanguifluus]
MRRPFWFPTWLFRKVDERPEVNRNEGLPTNYKDGRLRPPFDLTCPSQATSYTRYPNQWAKIRENIREPAAELLGTMILILVGTGVNCQFALSADVNISPSPQGSYLGFNVAWGCGMLCTRVLQWHILAIHAKVEHMANVPEAAALGVWVSGGVSGGHINPAVTLCMAIFRGLPWSKAFTYILGQIIGAWIGALIVFANYSGGIDIFEGSPGQRTLKTARLFSTYPLTYVSSANCFFDEFIGAFILVFVVFAISDKQNTALHPSLVPLVIFFVILGIGAAFGMQTGYAVNPARDLGPRIMTAMVGYGSQVFTFRHHYWIWGPIIASCCGGLVAGLLYDLFIYRGPESFINRPDAGARASFGTRQGRNRSPVQGEESLVPEEYVPRDAFRVEV